ncbi:ATP-binding protein [Streptomyces sp. NPDC001709]
MPAVQPAATGHPGYDVTMSAVPESAEEARRLTRQAMTLWRLAGQAETAALLISELVTNAITHTSSDSVRIIVARPAPTRVRLEVVDKAPSRLPVRRVVDAEAVSGRGLHLLEALADRWGYDLLSSNARRGPSEKSCWAELCVDEAR